MPHAADSGAQRDAEEEIRELVAAQLGVALAPAKLPLSDATRVQVDAASADEQVLVEIFARQGALKGGQVKKVTQDAFKLLTLKRDRPNARLYLAFASAEAAAYVSNPKGWITEALRLWGIDVLLVDVPSDTRKALLAAQARQVMTGRPDDGSPLLE